MLDDSRGKVLVALTNTGDIRALDADGRPMFTSAEPGDPDVTFVRFDGPSSVGLDHAVRAGNLVRTRTDAPTGDARCNDTTDRDLALASGAHYLSTDYDGPSAYFDSPYVVAFADGAIARCNPGERPAVVLGRPARRVTLAARTSLGDRPVPPGEGAVRSVVPWRSRHDPA